MRYQAWIEWPTVPHISIFESTYETRLLGDADSLKGAMAYVEACDASNMPEESTAFVLDTKTGKNY